MNHITESAWRRLQGRIDQKTREDAESPVGKLFPPKRLCGKGVTLSRPFFQQQPVVQFLHIECACVLDEGSPTLDANGRRTNTNRKPRIIPVWGRYCGLILREYFFQGLGKANHITLLYNPYRLRIQSTPSDSARGRSQQPAILEFVDQSGVHFVSFGVNDLYADLGRAFLNFQQKFLLRCSHLSNRPRGYNPHMDGAQIETDRSVARVRWSPLGSFQGYQTRDGAGRTVTAAAPVRRRAATRAGRAPGGRSTRAGRAR
jgi:hypothetical protein